MGSSDNLPSLQREELKIHARVIAKSDLNSFSLP